MDRIRITGSIALGAMALGIAACSGGSSSPPPAGGTTELSVALMDAPVDDVIAVYVKITGIWLKPEGEGPAIKLPLEKVPMTVNLLGLTEQNAAILVDEAVIPAGDYAWLSMDVDADIDGIVDSYVVTDTGAWVELDVPSDRVRLVSGFEAPASDALQLIFDWDLRKGLVHPPGRNGYILKPAFRVIGVEAFGRISGTVDLATVTAVDNDCNADDTVDLNVDVGNTVYFYDGLGVTPDDIDEETDVAPVATVDALLNDDSTGYDYSALLPFGDYTVAFTCQSANDGAESNDTGNTDPADDTVSFLEPAVDVTLSSAGTSAIVDF